ncbi:MAG: M48 family metallopeptidase [Gammaproteobacteria bacterium]|nr:M48 family metallopeptidase [Gammaproteobacteria bacterium]MDH5591390.1 M48 family metallopeptidase [Gammaproteobacteria bacterium]
MQTIKGEGFTVEVVKSRRRKTMALKVTHTGVSIHIPTTLPLATAQAFILQKTVWIQNKIQQQKNRPLITTKRFINGEHHLYMGEEYPLSIARDSDTQNKIDFDGKYILFLGAAYDPTPEVIRSELISWYHQQAISYLRHKTMYFSDIIGLIPRSITVKNYKARWGSCNSRADIQFNWKIIMAPTDIIDYIIVHELCHIQQHNHSPAFWQLVKHYYPNYKTARLWLKNNGYKLET